MGVRKKTDEFLKKMKRIVLLLRISHFYNT
ncbi:MAG: hypothetical protein RL115_1525 [Bacteroidota bacterium]|jgi:hypothetical protein